ncbi:hypothetical protein FKM82_007779 [Ascaphus truei]
MHFAADWGSSHVALSCVYPLLPPKIYSREAPLLPYCYATEKHMYLLAWYGMQVLFDTIKDLLAVLVNLHLVCLSFFF